MEFGRSATWKPQSDKTFSVLGQLQHQTSVYPAEPKLIEGITSSSKTRAQPQLIIIITASRSLCNPLALRSRPSLDCHSNEPVSRQATAPDIFCDIFHIKNVLKNNKHADLDAEGWFPGNSIRVKISAQNWNILTQVALWAERRWSGRCISEIKNQQKSWSERELVRRDPDYLHLDSLIVTHVKQYFRAESEQDLRRRFGPDKKNIFDAYEFTIVFIFWQQQERCRG